MNFWVSDPHHLKVGFSRLNNEYDLVILGTKPVRDMSLLCISTVPYRLQGGSHPPVAVEETSSERAVTCPRQPSRSGAGLGFVPDLRFPVLTLVTAALLQGHFPSLRVEIAVYPISMNRFPKRPPECV